MLFHICGQLGVTAELPTRTKQNMWLHNMVACSNLSAAIGGMPPRNATLALAMKSLPAISGMDITCADVDLLPNVPHVAGEVALVHRASIVVV